MLTELQDKVNYQLSIITINFNNIQGLKRTIESVINQTEKDFEYLIIDGGSNDGSVNILKKYDSEISYWVSEKDNGIYDAINKGIQRAHGEYLMFLNSGDTLFANETIASCQRHITDNIEKDIIYGNTIFYNDNEKQVWNHPDKLDISFFKNDNINHQSSFVKATLFDQFGLYPEKYRLAGDHWLFLNSFVNGKKFLHIDCILVNYDTNGVSSTNRINYNVEMENIWQEIVPLYVSEFVDAYLNISYAKKYGFFKLIVPIHHIYTYNRKIIALIILLILTIIVILRQIF